MYVFIYVCVSMYVYITLSPASLYSPPFKRYLALTVPLSAYYIPPYPTPRSLIQKGREKK